MYIRKQSFAFPDRIYYFCQLTIACLFIPKNQLVMTDRIQHILKSMNLSPSQLADQISVQRSSLSHILSGRNKPSLDFVTKVLSSYPEISSDWLLFGTGSMIRNTGDKQVVGKNSEKMVPSEKPNKQTVEPLQKKESSMPDDAGPLSKTAAMVKGNDKPVESIVLFYADNTFKTYLPSK